MPYKIEKLSEEPILLAQLMAPGDKQSIGELFMKVPDLLGRVEGPACLLLDVQSAGEIDEQSLVDTLRVYSKMVPTIKSDAPIFEAFLGGGETLVRVSKQLERFGVVIPAFEDKAKAIAYLNLKVDGAHVAVSVRKKDTQEVGDTLFLRTREMQKVDTDAQKPGTGELIDGQFPPDGELHLTSDDNNREIVLRPTHDMLIGRRDSTFKEPDVDFSPWGGFYQGVSRRHAKLSLSSGRTLEITDLASANGTFLNGKRLKPFLAYPIVSGDELTIGRLKVQVAFQANSA